MKLQKIFGTMKNLEPRAIFAFATAALIALADDQFHNTSSACTISPGSPIQPYLDRVAASEGGGSCLLLRGIHLVAAPVAIPSNVELRGEGASLTVLRSLMATPAAITKLCGWSGGNCAVLTVNNDSRENITIRDLTIDGGLTTELKAFASTHCGGFGIGIAPGPCPPCRRVGYPACMWNNFGILLWDYHAGGKVRNEIYAAFEQIYPVLQARSPCAASPRTLCMHARSGLGSGL